MQLNRLGYSFLWKAGIIQRFILIVLFILSYETSYGEIDSIEIIHFYKIEKSQSNDSFDKYFDEIDKLRKHYQTEYFSRGTTKKEKQKWANKINHLFQKYEIYRKPTSPKESQLVRRYFAVKIYWIKKTKGDIQLTLEEGLKASDYIQDYTLLDSFAYRIEMEVGKCFAQLGDNARAILYYEKCIPGILARKKYRRLSYLYTNIGISYNKLRDVVNAKKSFTLGIEMADQANCLDCKIANASWLLDLSYWQKDYDSFLKLAKANQDLINQLPIHKREKRQPKLDNTLGIFYFDKGAYKKSLALFEKIKSVKLKKKSSSINRELAKINLSIAQCYKNLKQFQDFKEEIKNCNYLITNRFTGFIIPDSLLYAENVLMEILSVTSSFYEHKYAANNNLKYLDTAFVLLEKAIKVGKLLDDQIIYSRAKNIFTNEYKRYVSKAVELTYEKQKTSGGFNEKDWQNTRSLFNASKDQILNDQIVLNKKIQQLDKADKIIVDSLVQVLIAELGNSKGDKQKIIQCKDAIHQITGVLTLNSTSEKISDDYLEYLVTENDVFIYSSLEGSLSFSKLGTTNKLDSLINKFNDEIRSTVSEEKILKTLSTLGSFLIPKTIELPKHFIVIPDKAIATIPFDLLRKDSIYLVEKHVISFNSHYMQKTLQKNKNTAKMYCLSPEYGRRINRRNDDSDRAGFYALPYAKEEVVYLSSIFTESFRLEKSNSIDQINKQLNDHNIFHFAGHAKVYADSAYLVLNNDDEIYKWQLDQIYNHNFNLDLVTLSACETGFGQVQDGDGLNSLARSFQAAGAASVVYSLWTVNDMSTSTIMKDFYLGLKNGIPKSEALRNAKLNLLSTANPEKRHPYYWGAFVASGDMKPLQSSNIKTWKIGLFSLIIFLLLITILNKYRLNQTL